MVLRGLYFSNEIKITLAEQRNNLNTALMKVEEEICDKLITIFGGDPFDAETMCFEDITYDGYDNSCEMKQTNNDILANETQEKAIYDMGFSKFWICHKDGTEKVYFNPRLEYCRYYDDLLAKLRNKE